MAAFEKGIRIESDGTFMGTKIINLETGKQMANVTCIDIRLELGAHPIKAILEVSPVEIDITVPGPLERKTEKYENSKGNE